jgi:hypothetical protein
MGGLTLNWYANSRNPGYKAMRRFLLRFLWNFCLISLQTHLHYENTPHTLLCWYSGSLSEMFSYTLLALQANYTTRTACAKQSSVVQKKRRKQLIHFWRTRGRPCPLQRIQRKALTYLSVHVMSCHVMSCHVMPCQVMFSRPQQVT